MVPTTKTESPKPLLPWKTRLAISLISAVADVACRPDGTVNRRLLKLVDLKAPPMSTPINNVSTSDLTIDATKNLWFRLFTPTTTTTTSLPVIIFFHGGGFAFLSPSSIGYDVVCRRLCREIPAVIVSVNYRLSPEHRYPAPYDDGETVLKFLDNNRAALPDIADVANCFLAGDSAGANVAHHVAVRVCGLGLRELRVVGLVSIQPYFGGQERTGSELRLEGAPFVSVTRTDWLWKAFLAEGLDRDHGAVNVSGPNAVDLSGLDFPDTVVFVGGFDPLRDWQWRYYKWLKRSGKEVELIKYPKMFHAFYGFPEIPESFKLILQVKDFITRRVNNNLK